MDASDGAGACPRILLARNSACIHARCFPCACHSCPADLAGTGQQRHGTAALKCRFRAEAAGDLAGARRLAFASQKGAPLGGRAIFVYTTLEKFELNS
jgi:hypothetical protein